MGQAGVSVTHKAGCGVLTVVESRGLIWLSNPALTKLLCHHQGQLKAADASMKDSVNGHPTHRPRQHSLSQDYEWEFPAAGSRPQPGAGRTEPWGRHSIEAVDLESEVRWCLK